MYGFYSIQLGFFTIKHQKLGFNTFTENTFEITNLFKKLFVCMNINIYDYYDANITVKTCLKVQCGLRESQTKALSQSLS